MCKKYTDAKNLIKMLVEEEKIHDAVGKITMQMADVSVIIKQRDVIGNVLQEWIGELLKKRGFYFRTAIGQTFPDFYFSESNSSNICEIKTFFSERGPGFDVAYFTGYIESLKTHPYRLDSDYIIFSYTHNADTGNIGIDKIWHKKVWEITGPTEEYSLNCQRKKGQIVNIRPVRWFSENAKNKPFESKEAFISALYNTYKEHTNELKKAKVWLNEVITGYCEFSGENRNLFETTVLNYNR